MARSTGLRPGEPNGHAADIRFVIHTKDEDSGRRQGLFQALSDLEDRGVLSRPEQTIWNETYEWFRRNLRKPRRFSRSSKSHAKKLALSWFKDSATEHIQNMNTLLHVHAHGVLVDHVHAHGVLVDVIRTTKPGYIVYEDQHQVVAEPFGETAT